MTACSALRAMTACSVLLAMTACSRPVAHARTARIEPTYLAEATAEAHEARRSCASWGDWLFPGVGQLCADRAREGGVLLASGAAELATAVVVAKREGGAQHPGWVLPATAFQDLWLYSAADALIHRQLADRKRFVPQDSSLDLLAAPLNLQVLKRPQVWAGIVGLVALGVGTSMLLDGSPGRERVGDDPNIFGTTMNGAVGYPLAAAAGGAFFTHVAIAEETMFRGVIQSGLARSLGERTGWILGSLIFGGVHALNALSMAPEQRGDYLMFGVPFITAVGSYIGWEYRASQYSLASPTAIHFWYDWLLSATYFVLDPSESLISARVSLPI